MKRKIAGVILFCLIVVFALTLIFNFPDHKKQYISPIPDKRETKVLGIKIITTLTPTPTDIPTPTQIPTPLPTVEPSPTPIPITSEDIESYFQSSSSQYSVDKDFLKRVANCESGLNPNATYMSYAGLFQFSEGAWATARNRMGKDNEINLRFNPKEAIQTAAFLLSEHQTNLWPNCAR